MLDEELLQEEPEELELLPETDTAAEPENLNDVEEIPAEEIQDLESMMDSAADDSVRMYLKEIGRYPLLSGLNQRILLAF